MTLEAYTEKAISVLGGGMPHIAYLPPSLRTRPMPDSVLEGERPEVQVARIVEADPLGFLGAMMNGQIVITFRAESAEKDHSSPTDDKPKRGRPSTKPHPFCVKIGEENGRVIYAEYHSPSIADRMRIAMFLTTKILTHGGNAEPPEPVDPRDQEMMASVMARIEVEKKALTETLAIADNEPQ